MAKIKKTNHLIKNLILIFFVIMLVILPLIINKKGQFRGSDENGTNTITEINKDYKPWFKSLWKPPSAEIENFLFALQAALGAGFIGYYIGYVQGKGKSRK